MYRTALTKGVLRGKTIEPLPRFVQPILIGRDFCCLTVVGIPYSVYAIRTICILYRYYVEVVLVSRKWTKVNKYLYA